VRPHNFVSDDDYLVLEDERGRVRLVGPCVNPSEFVTGTPPPFDTLFTLLSRE